MNEKLLKRMQEDKKIVVCGLEGSGKSKDVLDCILNSGIIDFENHYVIYAMSSYAMLKERQAELIKYHGLTDRECPVVAVGEVEDKNKCFVDCKGYYKETKIILMAVQAIKRCKHLTLDPIGFEKKSKTLDTVIIDEFDYMSTIIPSLDHLMNANKVSSSKKSALEFIKNNYSTRDYDRYKDYLKDGKADYFMVAYYIERNEWNDIRTIFITSEQIPQMLLREIGFSEELIESPEFKKHTIHVKSDLVNRFTFNKLNDGYLWGIFGFNHIITDKYNPDMELVNEIDCINVKSHVAAKGSNEYEGKVKELLTIVSHVPDCAIRSLKDAINSHCSSKLYKEEGHYTFEQIKALYYRDRLFQAVGRVIGHRGDKNGVNDAWVLISNLVMDGINKGIKDGLIDMPYSIDDWDFNDSRWVEIVESVNNDRRIDIENVKERKNKRERVSKDEMSAEANKIIDQYFVVDIDNKDCYITVSELKSWLIEKKLSKITAKYVANYLGCEQKMKNINYKVQRVVAGCKLK